MKVQIRVLRGEEGPRKPRKPVKNDASQPDVPPGKQLTEQQGTPVNGETPLPPHHIPVDLQLLQLTSS